MTIYNTELLREIFEDSLSNLGLSLLQAKDWINSRLVEYGIEYSYEQLYRLRSVGAGKKHSRKRVDKTMLQHLAQIEFWWNEKENRPYGVEEIEQAILPLADYNQPQLSLLEIQEIEELKKRLERLTPQGRIAVLAGTCPDSNQSSVTMNTLRASLSTAKTGESKMLQSDEEFYRLKNWLTESLNLQGRPGQPRTAAQENGYRGRLGENLNLLLEGDRRVSLTKEDYVALSFVLLKIKGWDNFQPLLLPGLNNYRGDWSGMLLDLRRNGQPASL